jgi:hypothetical protein
MKSSRIGMFALPVLFVLGCTTAATRGEAPSAVDEGVAPRAEDGEMGRIERELREMHPDWDERSDEERAVLATEYEEQTIRELHPEWDDLDDGTKAELGRAYLAEGGALVPGWSDGDLQGPQPPIPVADYSYTTTSSQTRCDDLFRGLSVVARSPILYSKWNGPTSVTGSVDCLQSGTTPIVRCGMILVQQPAFSTTTCVTDAQCGAVGTGYCGVVGDPTLPNAQKSCFQKVGPPPSITATAQTHTLSTTTQVIMNETAFGTLGNLSRQLILAGVPSCGVVPQNQSAAFCLRAISPLRN